MRKLEEKLLSNRFFHRIFLTFIKLNFVLFFKKSCRRASFVSTRVNKLSRMSHYVIKVRFNFGSKSTILQRKTLN